MAVANTIDINIFSLIILAFIYFNTNKRAERSFTQHRLFTAMIGTLAILLVADSLSWVFDGLHGKIYLYMNWAATLLMYLLVPIIPSLYVLYSDYQAYHDEKRFRKLAWPLAAYVLLDAAFNLSSILTGWTFTIDANNYYHRGPYIALHTLSCYAVLLYTCIFIIRHKKKIDERHYFALLAFFVPPAIGGVLQGFLFGLALIWSGVTLSILMLYFNIQDRRLDTDFLTGTYNRRLLDSYVKGKIQTSTHKRTFSAILIDLDDFKLINDNFGHGTGDDALLDAVGLLKSCLRHGDLISRYGGDEFLIILDIDSQAVLEETVERLRSCFEWFNRNNSRPYTLSFSTGYAVYDMAGGMDPDQFIKHIDTLMYENKRQANKQAAPAGHKTHQNSPML